MWGLIKKVVLAILFGIICTKACFTNSSQREQIKIALKNCSNEQVLRLDTNNLKRDNLTQIEKICFEDFNIYLYSDNNISKRIKSNCILRNSFLIANMIINTSQITNGEIPTCWYKADVFLATLNRYLVFRPSACSTGLKFKEERDNILSNNFGTDKRITNILIFFKNVRIERHNESAVVEIEYIIQ